MRRLKGPRIGRVVPTGAIASRRWRAWKAGTFALLTALALWRFAAVRIVVMNLSPSISLGLYVAVDDEPAVGRLVEFRLPDATRDAAPYLRHRVLLKPIAAGPGDLIDTSGEVLWINGRRIAPIHTSDSQGRPLPVWRAKRVLEPDEFFVYSGRVPNSLDSRYYGPVRRSRIIAVRVPLWTWGDADNAHPINSETKPRGE